MRIAFKWLMRAFAGHLFVRELLALWDRVIAFDSLEILSLFAVALFSFRRANLLHANTAPAAEVFIMIYLIAPTVSFIIHLLSIAADREFSISPELEHSISLRLNNFLLNNFSFFWSFLYSMKIFLSRFWTQCIGTHIWGTKLQFLYIFLD